VPSIYLAQQQYDEEEQKYSNADGQDNCPEWYSGWFLHLNVWECSSDCLQNYIHHGQSMNQLVTAELLYS